MTERAEVVGVAVGGAVGTLARYALSTAFPVRAGRFPWTTLAINLVGAFLLAVLFVVVLERRPALAWLRLPLGIGVVGGFTTMSAVAVETDLLVTDGHTATAVTYVVVSVVGAMVAVVAGTRAARR